MDKFAFGILLTTIDNAFIKSDIPLSGPRLPWYIIEFFILELPVKRLHPSVKNEDNIDNFVFTTKKTKDTDPRVYIWF